MNELEDNLNEYINGSISFLTYRERRSNYINNFVDSGYLPDDTIPLNSMEQQQIKNAVREEMQKSKPLDTSTYSITGGTNSVAKKQYLGLAVLIIIATVTWYYSSQLPVRQPHDTTSTGNNIKQLDSSKNENNSKISEDKKDNKTISAPNADDQAFVINFIEMDKWNSQTLSDFLVKWQSLSRLEKKKTRQSQSFIRLKNSLRLRILEQQALQATTNKAAQRQENLLIWFASQLSIPTN
ncbi:MAG: hypothetical protein OEX07_05415 [Gammaproteobacteria bacterium]|nr:hypothetical protein [Gammaproteobacteria bacterium]